MKHMTLDTEKYSIRSHDITNHCGGILYIFNFKSFDIFHKVSETLISELNVSFSVSDRVFGDYAIVFSSKNTNDIVKLVEDVNKSIERRLTHINDFGFGVLNVGQKIDFVPIGVKGKILNGTISKITYIEEIPLKLKIVKVAVKKENDCGGIDLYNARYIHPSE
jgi:hypothetical protein